jgi:hypothetical protein
MAQPIYITAQTKAVALWASDDDLRPNIQMEGHPMTSNMCQTCHTRPITLHTLGRLQCYTCFTQWAIGRIQELEQLKEVYESRIASLDDEVARALGRHERPRGLASS